MKRKDLDNDRRSFLRTALATGVAAGAVTSVDAVAGLAPGSDGARESGEPDGYRLTDHVKAYYQSLKR